MKRNSLKMQLRSQLPTNVNRTDRIFKNN